MSIFTVLAALVIIAQLWIISRTLNKILKHQKDWIEGHLADISNALGNQSPTSGQFEAVNKD